MSIEGIEADSAIVVRTKAVEDAADMVMDFVVMLKAINAMLMTHATAMYLRLL
jgi:hypothetical protein